MNTRTGKLEVAHLDPYLGDCVERATTFALGLHAEELATEHLLAAILEDEDCAAARVILHAFADPETIRSEVIALCPGTMIVGSKRSVPFSMLGAGVLSASRSEAVERRHAEVTVAHIFVAAVRSLGPEIQDALRAAGLDLAQRDPIQWPGPADEPVPAQGLLLHHFNADARRALSTAARATQSAKREAISPAHILIGCLECDEELGSQTGLRASLVRQIVAGRDDDPTPIPVRPIAPTPELVELFQSLPADAGSDGFLAALVRSGSEEIQLLLNRQRVTIALLESVGSSFMDPAP